MSDISLYEATVVVLERAINSLVAILRKAAEHPDAASFPSARLYDDMLPLSFQVKTIDAFTRRAITRLTGAEVAEAAPDDGNATLADLVARAEGTLAVLKTVDPKSLEGVAASDLELSIVNQGTFELKGRDYVLGWLLPNAFFHLQTTYAILRSKGVPVGKMDYLLPFLPMIKKKE